MQKKEKSNFEFHFDIKTKTGIMRIGKDSSALSLQHENEKVKTDTPFSQTSVSDSGFGGYGLNLI